MKAYELTEQEVENGIGNAEKLTELCRAQGYSSLKSYLNDNGRWRDEVSVIEQELEESETDTATLKEQITEGLQAGIDALLELRDEAEALDVPEADLHRITRALDDLNWLKPDLD